MNLNALEEKIRAARDQVSTPIEWPEPAQRLDMEARGNDQVRQFKHLHQMCTLHAENFATAGQIKVVALIDGYILNARAQSAIGIYLFARSALELAAFTHEVMVRLSDISSKPEEQWRSKGEQFFGVIMRARFGTSNPEHAAHLKQHGVSKKHLEPLGIMQAIARLQESSGGAAIRGKYDLLCDFVHHNLSSHYTSSSGFRVGDTSFSSGGGELRLRQKSPIARYEYPVPSKAEKAVEDSINVVDASFDLCVRHINEMPRSPFPEHQIVAITGNILGLQQLPHG